MAPMGILSILTILFMIAALISERFSTETVFFFGLSALLISGAISIEEAFAGFSNKGMITVGVLFIVSRGVENTGALNSIAKIFLNENQDNSLFILMLKMMFPVTFLSAFLNNTPIVMIFTPIIKKWAESRELSASKFLIPLSYAAIFGGICTLIGTSTNLVVHGMMLESGFEGFTFFELAKVGIPGTIIGFLYLSTIGKRFLLDRKDIIESLETNPKEYLIELKTQRNCPLINKTVQSAGLRNLKGVYLTEIERNGQTISPVSGDEIIKYKDRLMFTGITTAIVDLQSIPGLMPVADATFDRDIHTLMNQLVEVALSFGSPLVGRTVKEYNFRAKYQSVVIAVHRNGERIRSKIGDIRLKPGDSLILRTTSEFTEQWRNSQDFILVSDLDTIPPNYHKKAWVTLIILAVMILGGSLGRFLPQINGNDIGITYFAIVAALLMIALKCVDLKSDRHIIHWNILITIACAFGISKALQNSGAAADIAGVIINISCRLGPIGALAGVYLLTNIFTEIITNNAAAALMFPIALATAQQLGLDPKPFFVAITIAASASFSTPIGYQTNLIVQGPGGYKFRDYFKVGLPLNIIFMILSVFLIQLFWPF